MARHHFVESDVASAWNRNADRWSKSVRAGFDLYRELYTLPKFLSFIPNIGGQKVIDLGCGEGSNTRRFARLGGHLTGIDLAEELINRARREEQREPLGVRYEVCSFTHIEISCDNNFDCVLSTLALMNGPDLGLAMKEAHRVLVPGGRLCFSVLHPCFITRAAKWLQTRKGVYTGLKVGKYFDRLHTVEQIRFGKHPVARQLPALEVPNFPRTLSDYMNAVCDAGFRISKIEEPRPDKAISEKHLWLSRWREHAPMVLFVAAVKD